MRFVVDASVAVKWLVAEENAEVAQELSTSGREFPRLMASKVAGAQRRKVRTGEMESGAAGVLPANITVRWAPTWLSLPIRSVWRWRSTARSEFASVSRSRSRIVSARWCGTADLQFAEVLASAGHGEIAMTPAGYAAAG